MSTMVDATPELTDFRASVRTLVRSSFQDTYHERSKGTQYPYDSLKTLGDNGLLGLLVPEEHGGQGAGLQALGIACEETAYADSSCAYPVFAHNVMADMLIKFAAPEVVKRWLGPLLAGEAVCAIALTEPGSGSDAQALTTKAVPVDGGWELSGEKTSITQAPDADVTVVVARESDSGRISAFVMDMDQPGVSTHRFEDPGFRPTGRGSIAMDRAFVPDTHRLGEGGKGFAMIMQEFDLTRTLIAFMALGLAHKALDMTIEYVQQRHTFGRPLTHYQGVTFPIAEHLTHLTAVRALATRALEDREAGRAHTVEAAMLKWWAPQVAFQTVQDCVVLHGHVGWSEDLPLQSILRDVSNFQIGDGTAQIQKLIIARSIFGRQVMADSGPTTATTQENS